MKVNGRDKFDIYLFSDRTPITIRTGKKVLIEGAELTKKRLARRFERPPDWREVRVGLARPLQHKDKRTYVARMSKYPEVVQQLVSASVDQGMSERSQVYAVVDGGNGRCVGLSLLVFRT